MDMATAMGVELLTEEQYFELQKLGEFDPKTIELGKDASGDQKARRRTLLRSPLQPVFLYHNGAESYYAARAFRGSLRV